MDIQLFDVVLYLGQGFAATWCDGGESTWK